MDKKTRIKKISLYGRMLASVAVFLTLPASDILQNTWHVPSYLSVECAFAQPGATEAVPVRDDTKATTTRDSDLMNNLLERQKQLDNREKVLKEEERKLETLKREALEKIETLRALEEKMSPPLEVQKAEKDKKYQALAKMYEATPPEKAAVIFEKMDTKMAAEIMLRMNSKKAGAIWANISRDTGLEIVREITASQSVDTASATKIAKEISGLEITKPGVKPGAGLDSTARTDKEIAGTETVKPVSSQKKDAGSADKTVKEVTGAGMVEPGTSPRANAAGITKGEPKTAGSKKVITKKSRPAVYKPYAVQIKAVRDLEVAREYVNMLKTEGMDAYWSETNVKGKGTLYRILVGHYASREEAVKFMNRNRMESNYPGSYIYKSEPSLPKKKKRK